MDSDETRFEVITETTSFLHYFSRWSSCGYNRTTCHPIGGLVSKSCR
jgi:hypothetical protein